MIDKKIDDKEAQEVNKIYNHYLDKRTDITKNTQFKVEEIYGVILNEETITSLPLRSKTKRIYGS